MTLEQELQELGFAKNEAIIYTTITKLGSARASQIIKQTGFHRNIVYDNLAKLIEKGLVSTVIKGNSHVYNIMPVENIVENLESEKQAIQNKIKTANIVKEKLKAITQTENSSNVTLHTGKNAIRQVLKETIIPNSAYSVIGGPQTSVEIMGETFWLNYNAKLKENKVETFMLFNEDLRDFVIKNQNTFYYKEIRYLDKYFDNLTEIFIQKEKVIIMIWSSTPTATVIHDAEAAKGYMQHFTVLWKMSKK